MFPFVAVVKVGNHSPSHDCRPMHSYKPHSVSAKHLLIFYLLPPAVRCDTCSPAFHFHTTPFHFPHSVSALCIPPRLHLVSADPTEFECPCCPLLFIVLLNVVMSRPSTSTPLPAFSLPHPTFRSSKVSRVSFVCPCTYVSYAPRPPYLASANHSPQTTFRKPRTQSSIPTSVF